MILFFRLHSTILLLSLKNTHFQADISSKRYHFVNRYGTSEVIHLVCRIYIAFFVTVPPDGVELVCREICSPPSILLR
jgi:hypothetical protein